MSPIAEDTQCNGEKCWKTYSHSFPKFTLDLPSQLSKWTTISFGMDSKESYPYFSTAAEDTENISATIFVSQSECNLSTHGISGCAKEGELVDSYVESDTCRHLDNGVIWGRPDFPTPAHRHDPNYLEVRKNLKCGGLTGAFALCAEKEGKAVVVCLSQKTDNPALAEQIFSTFRWTD